MKRNSQVCSRRVRSRVANTPRPATCIDKPCNKPCNNPCNKPCNQLQAKMESLTQALGSLSMHVQPRKPMTRTSQFANLMRYLSTAPDSPSGVYFLHSHLPYTHANLKRKLLIGDGDLHVETFKLIERLAKTHAMCRGDVRSDYLVDYMQNEATDLFIAFNEQQNDVVGSALKVQSAPQKSRLLAPCAFVTATVSKDYLKIGVICSDEKQPGSGTHMMHNVLAYADRRNLTVELSALVHAMGFYAQDKFGFKFVKNCPSQQNITNASILREKFNPKENYNLKYKALIEELHEKGFNASTLQECRNPNMKFKDIQAKGCLNDGFNMRRCR